MILDTTAENPAFPDGSLPNEDLQQLIDWVRARLGRNGHTSWHAISARRKLGNVLVEIEEERPEGRVRLIAKIAREERSRVTYTALTSLWEAGFRPPARHTVVEPVGWFPERHLIVLEKAPGVEVMDKVEKGDARSLEYVAETARWLAALHRTPVAFDAWPEESRIDKWVQDLSSIAPDDAAHIRAIAEAASDVVTKGGEALVPCHGDFHLMNMFVADDGRMTAIDVDKFGGREAAWEVGYFLAQSLSIGFHRLGSFEASREVRRVFLATYEEATGKSFSRARLGADMALILIKNLHYDLFAYKSGRMHILPGWLAVADACLAGDIDSV